MKLGRLSSDFPADGSEYFFDIAIEDAQSSLEEALQTNAPRHKRNSVRAVFAFIDGCHNFVRSHVESQASAYKHLYSVSDLAVLREESPYVDERGTVKTRQLKVPLITSIKALVKLLEKNNAAKHEVDLMHPGFFALSKAVEIRNRVVHPKNAKELDLSEEDIHTVANAFNWYLAFALRMSHASNESMRFWRKQHEKPSDEQMS